MEKQSINWRKTLPSLFFTLIWSALVLGGFFIFLREMLQNEIPPIGIIISGIVFGVFFIGGVKLFKNQFGFFDSEPKDRAKKINSWHDSDGRPL